MRREQPISRRFDRDVLNAIDDAVTDGEYEDMYEIVASGEKEEQSLRHYGEMGVGFTRVDGSVEGRFLVNVMVEIRINVHSNEAVQTLVDEAFAPLLGGEEFELVETDEGGISGWTVYNVKEV